MTPDRCLSCLAEFREADTYTVSRRAVPPECNDGADCPYLTPQQRALRDARAAIQQAKESKP